MDNVHKYPWRNPEKRDGRPLMTCDYCGSMHPADLAKALQAGAKLAWADYKYGWPHKVYVDGIPNPYAGELTVFSSTTRRADDPMSKEVMERDGYSTPILEETVTQTIRDGYIVKQITDARLIYENRKPMGTTVHAKFYTEHLQDATPEERTIIEQAMGLTFGFQNGKVTWSPT